MVTANRPGLNITGSITVEAWIKTTSTAQQGIVERFNSYGVGSINGGFVVALSDLSEDGIHIKASGYSKIAALWFDKLMAVR
jgi:lysophospholipase L1-like esterase